MFSLWIFCASHTLLPASCPGPCTHTPCRALSSVFPVRGWGLSGQMLCRISSLPLCLTCAAPSRSSGGHPPHPSSVPLKRCLLLCPRHPGKAVRRQCSLTYSNVRRMTETFLCKILWLFKCILCTEDQTESCAGAHHHEQCCSSPPFTGELRPWLQSLGC